MRIVKSTPEHSPPPNKPPPPLPFRRQPPALRPSPTLLIHFMVFGSTGFYFLVPPSHNPPTQFSGRPGKHTATRFKISHCY